MALFLQSKSNKIFWGIGLFFVALFIAVEGYSYYDQWRGEKRVEELAQLLTKIEKDAFDKKAADKIGGKTPQETLDLFIKAVESGDYELASKYFVIEKQEKWKKSLIEIVDAKKISIFLEPLHDAKNSKGAYLKEDRYFIDEPVSIEYLRYPSGNWKIEEI
ncbi:MAG: hypothetical protein CO014_00915 [Candidatus Tagabacteria bacterium CG_4_8_14_3_um_filter_41_8]|uniref:DUF4878 domain-containing protein n=1 Tax=Candidatus Tagabacteria bacterium CG_4_8_14_3_um_filter_41_8 TaxID=1975018 RepID=A0A2M8G971_9BACT|nr:MAG: hypothetical protein CO014_00915 [Candidatus Tagabacteria bacterium CG_4_8_14_3_um_filter_41_8]